MNIPQDTIREKSEALDARDVANYLLDLAHKENKTITPLQMIKLVYYCHGWYLGIYHEPLIQQNVEAWLYGPVIADIYHSCKQYGRQPISEPIRGYGQQQNFTDRQREVMNEVYDKYKNFTGLQLSAYTHREGTPWHTIWPNLGQIVWDKTNENPVIPNKVIEDYFANWREQGD